MDSEPRTLTDSVGVMTSVEISRPHRRRPALLRLILVGLLGIAQFGGLAVVSPNTAEGQVTPIEDEQPDDAPGLGRITGTPDPGPAPEDAGDRGGTAQLALAAVLFGGLLFIGWRIGREVTRNRSPNNHDERSV